MCVKHIHIQSGVGQTSSMAASLFYQMRNWVEKLHEAYHTKIEPLLMQLSQGQLSQVNPMSLRARIPVCGPIYKSPCSSHGCSGVALYHSPLRPCASPLIFLTLCFSIPLVSFLCGEWVCSDTKIIFNYCSDLYWALLLCQECYIEETRMQYVSLLMWLNCDI